MPSFPSALWTELAFAASPSLTWIAGVSFLAWSRSREGHEASPSAWATTDMLACWPVLLAGLLTTVRVIQHYNHLAREGLSDSRELVILAFASMTSLGIVLVAVALALVATRPHLTRPIPMAFAGTLVGLLTACISLLVLVGIMALASSAC
ncbi:MAG: hypothetical protein AAF533_01030 [Acidobacteriota bacterium]